MSDLPEGSLFDAEGFSKWLKRWRDAENLQWSEISRRSGLHNTAIHGLANGRGPSPHRAKPGSRGYDPSVTTMYRLAHALNLELGYVLEKGGLKSHGRRMDAFTTAERIALSQGLAAAGMSAGLADTTKALLKRLSAEIAETLPTTEETHEHS